MTVSLREITRERLWEEMQSGAGLVLLDALAPMVFAASHLPGAINMPLSSVDGTAELRIPDRDSEIVVYCSGPDCESSVEVAERLVELGYRNVRHYAGGKKDWREAGLPLEGGRA